jgi:hypothetical protein
MVASLSAGTVFTTASGAMTARPGGTTPHTAAPLNKVMLQTYQGYSGAPIDYTSTTGLSAVSSPGMVSIAWGPQNQYVVQIRTTTVGTFASVNVLLPTPGIGGCDSAASSGGGQLDALTMSGPNVVAAAIEFICARSDPFSPGAVIGTICVGLEPTPAQGYYLYGNDGSVTGFGNNNYMNYVNGRLAPMLNAPVVGMSTTPSGAGYWLAAADGGIFAYGDAGFHGSAGDLQLQQPIVGMASTLDGGGYWMVASDGGVFAYGDAPYEGSTGNIVLNQPIVGMARTADNKGYWLVASDGGVFAFGDAGYLGSMGGHPLNKPIVGMSSTPDGKGYWLVASDGGVFSFGDAPFYGSTGNIVLNQPIVGMTPTADGMGYWFTASDGGVFAYGDAPFLGSLGTLLGSIGPIEGSVAFSGWPSIAGMAR